MHIREENILEACRIWGNGLVAISAAYDRHGIEEAKHTANGFLDAAYGYALGPVLFKPTLSGGETTFRTTKRGALSYFVGNDTDYPSDNGFATKSWQKVQFETAESFIKGKVAMWMGWVRLTDANGKVTKVDKSFGYYVDPNNILRIVLHHSSLTNAK